MHRSLFLLLFAVALDGAAAERTLIAWFDDPAGDATGPGTYVMPEDPEFIDGVFDLRRFAVLVEGGEVVFEVTLGAPIRRPQRTGRRGASELNLWNGIYLQNVDIYLDTNREEGSGHAVSVPGRRVAFADGRTWEHAVVLAPDPGAAQTITVDTLAKDVASKVHFVRGLQVRGRTIVARVPAALLGGLPTKDWAYSVHVSGAQWERTYAVTDRIRGTLEPNALTLDVQPMAGAWAFGGGPDGMSHPRVVDVLVPPGVDQKAVLGSFVKDAVGSGYARVPFVSPSRSPR